MTEDIITSRLTAHDGREALAFTTTRTIGRDAEKLCLALGVDKNRFARPHQTHTTVTRQIAEEFFCLPENIRAMLLDGVDSVIYDVQNACIGISTADCIPVVCYDPEHHCAAAIHAGWRGTAERIVTKSIEAMQAAFHTEPSELVCLIGPGISLDSFEVGDEVYNAFLEAGFPMDDMAKKMPARDAEGNITGTKWHLDIKLCNKMQLLSMGVKEENITLSELDTKTDTRFFSARREGKDTGRMLTGIVLR